jgi:hypothetical protein
MEKEMLSLIVSTTGRLVVIEQIQATEDGPIAIHPEQISILIEWLKEAAAELAARDSEAARPQ